MQELVQLGAVAYPLRPSHHSPPLPIDHPMIQRLTHDAVHSERQDCWGSALALYIQNSLGFAFSP